MRRYLKYLIILILLLFCRSAKAENFCPANWTNGYTYCASLRLAHAQVPGTLSNYPALFCANTSLVAGSCNNNADFKTVANGGKVQNATTCCASTGAAPADWIISDCTNGSTTYNWDIELYTASTGAIIGYVNIPSLSTSTDTDVCVYFGKVAVTTYQGGATSAWNTNYAGVWHFPNGSTLDVHDSTSNANNGTATNTPTATTGEIDGGVSMVQASTQYVAVPDSFHYITHFTYEAWVKPTSFPNTYNAIFVRDGANGFAEYFVTSAGKLAEYTGVGNYDGSGSQTLSTGTWYLVTMTFDSVSGIVGYVNSTQDHTATVSGTLSAGTSSNAIGYDIQTTPRGWNGAMDEMRISSVTLSANWVAVDYNEVASQSSFAIWGTTQTASAVVTHMPPMVY